MFDSFLTPDVIWSGARALVLLAAFAAFAWALTRQRRDSAEQHAQLLQAQRDLAAQNQALGERLAALATLLATQPRRAEPLVEPAAAPREFTVPRRQPVAPSYETAKRMARSGASVEEIVASCGVAGTEARLLHRLHAGESQRDHAA